MKLGVLAASTLIGVASFASASFAQVDVGASATASRTQEVGSMATASRMPTPGPAPALQGNRPAAGMFPQPTGPMRSYRGEVSNVPGESTDIRGSLRRQ